MRENLRDDPSIAKLLKDVDIATRYCLKPRKIEEILPGTIWILNLQDATEKNYAYPNGRWSASVLHHKPNRPYLVVSESSVIVKTKLVTVIPLATYGNRTKSDLTNKNTFNLVEISSFSTKVESQGSSSAEDLVFASPSDIRTFSVDRFKRYLGSVEQDELESCTRSISQLLELKKTLQIRDIFPNKRLV